MKLARINSYGKLTEPTSFQGILNRYLSTQVGRQALASAMAMPLRRNIDYQGIARKALLVQPLPQGALPHYVPKELPVVQFKLGLQINERGKLTDRLFGKRVIFPTFEVFRNPTIYIGDVTQRRFDLIDRAVQKARDQIMAQEDDNILKAIDTLGGDIVTSDSGNNKE